MLKISKKGGEQAKPEPRPDVSDTFPRGRPDGDKFQPVASAAWISTARAREILGVWQEGRFLLGRDSAGQYAGHSDNRHILNPAHAN